ncbi:sugar lactone lactonase YvrE [Arthrobacter stackebrandtii]|uniref:Sugar lactone lactonase YvrE n=1 Tax=Arthrobacter stackebrandtii TaxID=272161 RepID=A0ABS4Z1T2_9MICC|nr:SMP-30/gluconolactonase/LRE family protein [Arthrobacter stackebrandtii]MBP2415013.1 sugar lactone lactonase YvrE [Arthrobacter stackebrandtii]PYH00834.1 gluconolaconase [Arthrobacter stackebrandtii]
MENRRIIAEGIGLGESARWHGGRFWFADWTRRSIHAVDPDGTEHQQFSVPTFPITFDWLPDGELLTVSGSAGELLTLTPTGDFAHVASLNQLSGTPWNEVAAHGENAYVNCIGYNYPGPARDSGIIALVRPGGSATVVAEHLAFPNGMAVVDGGTTLLVAESNAGCLTAFDIRADGSLGGRHVWAAVPGSAPDGICPGKGGIWYADVPNRQCVLVARGGEVLRTVELDRGAFSCAVGGEDAGTLLVMAAKWPDAMDPAAAASGRAVAVSLAVGAET